MVFGYYNIFLSKNILTKRKHYAKIGISNLKKGGIIIYLVGRNGARNGWN